MPPLIDLTGQRFERLRAIDIAERRGAKVHWRCACDCGNETITISAHLRSGHTRSCGCLLDEARQTASVTHGRTDTREYKTWLNMQQRCTNPKSEHYECYGGRGIEIRFASFEAFYSELGDCPPGLTVERIDNNGHYESGNVRWATMLEQGRNTRKNRNLALGPKRQPLSVWAAETGIKADTIARRIRRGWAVDLALTEPVDRLAGRFQRSIEAVGPCQ